MRRQRIELTDVADRANLVAATWKAAAGKRDRPSVTRFLSRLDTRLNQLADDILSERVPYGSERHFWIRDPKLRRITAARFEDRILHHAILNIAEPTFERRLVASTYACRRGKGVHAAVTHVQRVLHRAQANATCSGHTRRWAPSRVARGHFSPVVD